MHAGLLGRNSSCRIILEKSIEEVQTILFKVRNECTGFITFPLRESGFVVGERGDAGPDGFIWGTEETVIQGG